MHVSLTVPKPQLLLQDISNYLSILIILFQVIGKNRVAVPTHLFKVILAEDEVKPTALGEILAFLSARKLLI